MSRHITRVVGLSVELPRKAVEILQDPKIYKLGVQVRGDGLKILRDRPEAFPNGISSLLELSRMARKADAINTGPGGGLIALAKLVSAYLGKTLPKGKVRSSNWSANLDASQIECELVFLTVHWLMSRRSE